MAKRGAEKAAIGRRRLDANCNSGESLDSCLSRECGLSPGASSCSCSGVLNGNGKGLTGDTPTELGLCTGLTTVYVHEISFVATCRRDVRLFFVLL